MEAQQRENNKSILERRLMGTEGKIRHMTIDVGAVGAPTPRDDLKESASKAEEVEKEKQD
jgi:hypothetical protein